MKVSIIMPTYNRANTISRAIKSIINQTYDDLELIIVDDGSVDNTKEVISEFDDKRIKYIYQKNSGACSARNAGIKISKGKYIAFLDSDDEWNINKLEKQIKFIEEKNAKVVFCNYFYEKAGKIQVAINKLKKDYLINLDLLDKNYITTGALFIEKELIIKKGMFDEDMPRYQDWELVLRLSNDNKIYFQNECLLTLHYQKESISSSTSLSKKIIALEKIYSKNSKLYELDKKSYSHLCWSIGLYNLCLGNLDYKNLETGVFHNGINVKRLFIYVLIKIGFRKLIVKEYLKNH